MKTHQYTVSITWQGNLGVGTKDYTSYERNFVISADDKVDILASSDPAFRGDKHKWNPEELLLASISSCHKLWYLHLCAINQIVVQTYQDNATAIMNEGDDKNAGQFVCATLNPVVKISQGDQKLALALHEQAHKLCFIANSIKFPVQCQATVLKAP
ncbi:Organic hydroperoxide reductase OsmC/OhrA [Moraxella cuniculi DSM 21768]|uniref:Organic hydroperoxide reductase OsmC/OhrA n=1 Tax=Moraxella cuniculi DSM 21768 TaxID=1122245 RepID=A0A1N7F2F0_9GAMM|nr:OsmC family protein [Moraxella cuniculi]OOS05041.1 peroxiredoxin [Moraxella cuniculi]SIR94501.1 Organic hydroperoxide reductase OsmC/OhrA [Moraxella cuniculi DSM 21768]